MVEKKPGPLLPDLISKSRYGGITVKKEIYETYISTTQASQKIGSRF
jgi:hypothetical protein